MITSEEKRRLYQRLGVRWADDHRPTKRALDNARQVPRMCMFLKRILWTVQWFLQRAPLEFIADVEIQPK